MIEIKVEPYRNSLEPIKDFKDTKIKLLEDRLEYHIHYMYEAEFHIPHEPDEECETIREDCIIYDKGAIVKDAIEYISVFTEDYGKQDTHLPNELSYLVGIHAGSQLLNIRVKSLVEANKVYKGVYNWKFNIKTENNEKTN